MEDLARRAVEGDSVALDTLLREVMDDVYRLAMRMLGHPADAEDATQEILVRVVTNLGSFRGQSAIKTWVWRIAANHLLSVRRGRREPEGIDFERLDGMLTAGLAMPVGAVNLADDVDRQLLEEEVKLGCTQMMLACLDRPHRLAFILGEVLQLPGPAAAAILDLSPAAYRQRLSRARRRLRAFMTASCGLVSDRAACRCRRQIEPSVAMGLLDPRAPVLALHPTRATADEAVLRQYRAIESVASPEEVMRSHPAYAGPASLIDRIHAMIAASP
ncbi:MAG TPA: RNA polymerase sigma factor [Candidatus Binatia bacterium]|nr:RNA polymerase sigma factor [Candidatus Binatia bacterium]